MILTASGRDVLALIDRVTTYAHWYAEVSLCSPFIDDAMLSRLLQLYEASRRCVCGFRIVTSPTVAAWLRGELPGHPSTNKRVIIAERRLHAKVYAALARPGHVSEAIVTSVNLTRGGVTSNIELGVRALSTTPDGARVLHDVRKFLRRLA